MKTAIITECQKNYDNVPLTVASANGVVVLNVERRMTMAMSNTAISLE